MPAAKATHPYHSARSDRPWQYPVAASAVREQTRLSSAFSAARPAGRKLSETR